MTRKWKPGGALAEILTPYGIPGLLVFLTLTAVEPFTAIFVEVVWSGCLAAHTWVNPPPGVDYYAFISPRMAIYHLSMLGLALILACLSPVPEGSHTIAIGDWLRAHWPRSTRMTTQN